MERRFSIYPTLNLRLKRGGFCKTGIYKKFCNYGCLTNYLCYLFLQSNGIVRRHDLLIYKIFSKEEALTNELLNCLVKAKFIKWDMEENIKNGFDRYQVFASIKLADLIDKESGEQKATKKEFLTLKQEINNLTKAVKRIIEKFDPPCTEEKINNYLKGG